MSYDSPEERREKIMMDTICRDVGDSEAGDVSAVQERL